MLGRQRRERRQAELTSSRPASRRSRTRRFHLAALAAAALYAGGAYVAYELYRSAYEGGRLAGGAADVAADGETDVQAAEISSQERAAMRALAARAQRSVFVIENTGAGRGSAFVAWVMQGDSYLITAHRAVAGVLEGGGRTVFVRRGAQIWTGRIVRSHQPHGLVLVRVPGELGRPLWQQRAEAGALEPGGPALIVPAGASTPIGEGVAAPQQQGQIRVRAHGERLNLGAPVLGDNGRVAGVVTQTEPGGVSLVAPIEAACEAEIRRCSG